MPLHSRLALTPGEQQHCCAIMPSSTHLQSSQTEFAICILQCERRACFYRRMQQNFRQPAGQQRQREPPGRYAITTCLYHVRCVHWARLSCRLSSRPTCLQQGRAWGQRRSARRASGLLAAAVAAAPRSGVAAAGAGGGGGGGAGGAGGSESAGGLWATYLRMLETQPVKRPATLQCCNIHRNQCMLRHSVPR